ncbi:LamB/YcsF family protein [Solitalea koreensis]|uniref:5-oxoprolinase subunit A n=1 Tax=Solitalea koreensis TaxID=543615 RepID=A0A521BZG0_9SPHI|nr:5-oxoprolinase subunit PxpA [Solitalea koreensis]SMO52579.1 UPF0271 protein [Solitalea koreensis]
MLTIDLNCDMGESFGSYKIGNDELIMDYISSVNIACGYHAGDPAIMRETVQLAKAKAVAIGAHPGFPDLQGFGRRNMNLSYQDVYDIMVYQIGALLGFVQAAGAQLNHVKPHGALYNMAAKQPLLAKAIAQAVFDVDKSLVLFGLSGSHSILEAEHLGLKTASEVFADRTYQDDGSLTPRTEPNSMIHDADQCIQHVLQMVKEGTVTTVTKKNIPIKADTICIHGDGEHGLSFAQLLCQQLKENQIQLKPITS